MRTATLGLLLLALSCATVPGSQRAASPEAKARDQGRKLPGHYSCSFLIGDEALADAECDIVRGEGKELHLAASGGIQSLSGSLTPTAYGFQFLGTYLCGGEEGCEEEVRTDFFESEEEGVYSGVIELLEVERLLTVTLRRE